MGDVISVGPDLKVAMFMAVLFKVPDCILIFFLFFQSSIFDVTNVSDLELTRVHFLFFDDDHRPLSSVFLFSFFCFDHFYFPSILCLHYPLCLD